MSLNQCNTYTVTVCVTFISNLWHRAPNKSVFISPLSPSVLSLCRAAQQSRRSFHIPPAASAPATASRLHLCPPGALRSSQPAEEDHAYAVPDQPGHPGRRHKLKHWPGAASQQLGAQQQHPPGDQVNTNDLTATWKSFVQLWIFLWTKWSWSGVFVFVCFNLNRIAQHLAVAESFRMKTFRTKITFFIQNWPRHNKAFLLLNN